MHVLFCMTEGYDTTPPACFSNMLLLTRSLVTLVILQSPTYVNLGHQNNLGDEQAGKQVT
jgi:hypothetical protein